MYEKKKKRKMQLLPSSFIDDIIFHHLRMTREIGILLTFIFGTSKSLFYQTLKDLFLSNESVTSHFGDVR